MQNRPVFFSARLFDHLQIEPYRRNRARVCIEFLALDKKTVSALTGGILLREGCFYRQLNYSEFQLYGGTLLCVFGPDGRCCRAYFFRAVLSVN